MRAFLEGLTGPAEAASVKEFAEDFLKFIQGKIKDETMEKRLRKLLAQGQEPHNEPVNSSEPETTMTLPEPEQGVPIQEDPKPVDGYEPPVAHVA